MFHALSMWPDSWLSTRVSGLPADIVELVRQRLTSASELFLFRSKLNMRSRVQCSVHSLDLDAGGEAEWKLLDNVGLSYFNGQAVSRERDILFIGGSKPFGFSFQFTDNVTAIDVKQRRSSVAEHSLRLPRGGASAARIANEAVLVAGGSWSGGGSGSPIHLNSEILRDRDSAALAASSALPKREGSTWTNGPKLQYPLILGVAATLGDDRRAVLVTAGQLRPPDASPPPSELLDPDRGQWIDAAPLLPHRSCAVACTLNGSAIVGGGDRYAPETNSRVSVRECARYDRRQDSWIAVQPLPFDAFSFVALSDDELLALPCVRNDECSGAQTARYSARADRWVDDPIRCSPPNGGTLELRACTVAIMREW